MNKDIFKMLDKIAHKPGNSIKFELTPTTDAPMYTVLSRDGTRIFSVIRYRELYQVDVNITKDAPWGNISALGNEDGKVMYELVEELYQEQTSKAYKQEHKDFEEAVLSFLKNFE